ncbi:hypothetical protein RQP46_006868 [Phenoliferia psychrophenolica]
MNWIRNECHEAKEAGKELWSWARHKDWKATAKGSFRRKYWLRWILIIILVVLVGLVSFYRDKIVNLFEPHKSAIVNAPASWLAPVGILSFGHEVVLLIVGLIWGLWIGFAIAAAGTFFGEMACYYTFKYLLTAKAQKIEHESVMYACLARLMREGGIWIVTLVRFSILPGHIVTAIQSTVGMRTWVYGLAIILSMPKQIVVVYLGVMFGTTKDTASADQIAKERRVSLSVFFGTTFATIIAAYVVYMRARKLYPEVLIEYNTRKGLEVRGDAAGTLPLGSVDDLEAQNQRENIPMYQRPGDGPPTYDDPFDSTYPEYEQQQQPGHEEGGGRDGQQQQQRYGGSGGSPTFSPLPMEEGFEIPYVRDERDREGRK